MPKKVMSDESLVLSKTSDKKPRTKNPELSKAPASAVKTKKIGAFSVPVYSLAGKEASVMELPKELFGAKVNTALLTQAIHIYQSNQKSHWSHTKTRGEVQGSTRKIWKQKGTGRARHGSITAPIFVGGGIALGPKSRKTTLDLPKKMRKAALISALSQKFSEKLVVGVGGLEKASGKTSEMAKLSKALGGKSILIVSGEKQESVERAVSNLKSVEYSSAEGLNILDIVKFKTLVLTTEAVAKLSERVSK